MSETEAQTTKKRTKKDDYIVQGSILAAAAVLTKIIGVVYRIPLTNILGDEGNGFYGYAYQVYAIALMISSFSLPTAVSKLVSIRLAKRQRRNAFRVFICSLAFAIGVGLFISLTIFLGAGLISTHLMKSPLSVYALRVLAPGLLIVAVMAVIRGYFQGMGNMIPTAISQVFEQIVNAVVSVIAAYELTVYGVSISKMSKLGESAGPAYGAAGGTLGTLTGAIAALIVVVIVFWNSYGNIKKPVRKDKTKVEDSYATITKVIIFTITPVLISSTIYNISNLLDNPIYGNIVTGIFDVSSKTRAELWGVYSAKYRVLTTMPIAIASSLSTAIVPAMVRSYIAKDKQGMENKVSLALKFSMLIAFPCGMGLSVLGGPINQLLFGDGSKRTATIMIFSLLTVVVFSLSTISNAILQGIDKLNIPIKNSAISLVLHLIILPVLLIVFRLDIYAVVIGDITFGLTVSILNAFSIKKHMGYSHDLRETFLRPFICSAAMGIMCYLAYWLTSKIIPINALCTLFAIMVAVIVYAVVLIISGTVTENELMSVPKGTMLIRLLKKVHLL